MTDLALRQNRLGPGREYVGLIPPRETHHYYLHSIYIPTPWDLLRSNS